MSTFLFFFFGYFSWFLVGRLVGWFPGSLLCWLVGWLVGWSVGFLVSCFPGWLVGWFPGLLLSRLVGWLVGWFSVLPVGWSVFWFPAFRVGWSVSWFPSFPAGCLVGWPANEPASQQASHAASQPASQRACHAASQPANEPASQPASQAAKQLSYGLPCFFNSCSVLSYCFLVIRWASFVFLSFSDGPPWLSCGFPLYMVFLGDIPWFSYICPMFSCCSRKSFLWWSPRHVAQDTEWERAAGMHHQTYNIHTITVGGNTWVCKGATWFHADGDRRKCEVARSSVQNVLGSILSKYPLHSQESVISNWFQAPSFHFQLISGHHHFISNCFRRGSVISFPIHFGASSFHFQLILELRHIISN